MTAAVSAAGPLRVLVADDSPTARALLTGVLEGDPGVRVVAQAADGAEAVELTRTLRPSAVVMDIEMPNVDGFEATKRIMIEQPTPIIIVSARYDADQVELGLRAVRAGALSILAKPPGPTAPDFAVQAARLVTLVKAMSQVKLVRHHGRPGRPATSTGELARPGGGRLAEPATRRRSGTIAVVGVAASTGGPAALYRFLDGLPRSLDIPVLVVQHIAEGFVGGLVKWLGGATVLPVCLAVDGAELTGGQVYVAPDSRDLSVRHGKVRLSASSAASRFCPSADVLMASMADAYGPAAAVVVLTGMGDDGLRGAEAVHRRGGLVLAQDADTSVVFGMPRAVIEAGLADVVGPTDELVATIVASARRRGRP